MVNVVRSSLIRLKLIDVFKKILGTKRKAQIVYEPNKKTL